MAKRIDITGKTYGHLTVTGLTEKVKAVRSRQWLVSCAACTGSAAFPGATLRAGMVTSCGCKSRLNLRGFNLVKRMKSSGQCLCKSLPASASANPFRPVPLQIPRLGSSSNPPARPFTNSPRNLQSRRVNSIRLVMASLPIKARHGLPHD